MKQFLLTGWSMPEIEKEIDSFLAEEKPFKCVSLVTPVRGSSRRFEYRGVTVRAWDQPGIVRTRYDAGIETESGK